MMFDFGSCWYFLKKNLFQLKVILRYVMCVTKYSTQVELFIQVKKMFLNYISSNINHHHTRHINVQ